MGGNALSQGNASPSAEANIRNDPEAADIVFSADCEISMVGLDVTNQVFMEKYGFIANLSILDLLFNLGPESTDYLHNLDISIDI